MFFQLRYLIPQRFILHFINKFLPSLHKRDLKSGTRVKGKIYIPLPFDFTARIFKKYFRHNTRFLELIYIGNSFRAYIFVIGTRALFNWGGGVLFTFCLYATTGTEQPIPGTIDEMAGRGRKCIFCGRIWPNSCFKIVDFFVVENENISC